MKRFAWSKDLDYYVLKKRNCASMKNQEKGFTLAELLIVVAIIGVLVAISIPIFNRQIEKSREAYDIATMRSAASAAIDLYYAGVHDANSASDANLSWSDKGGAAANNAYGAYNPRTGTFVSTRWDLPEDIRTYGKGTKVNGGTEFILGNDRGAYAPGVDYTQACVMVSIYPNANPAYAVVYWKTNTKKDSGPYIGGEYQPNIPKYSILITLN